MRFPRIETSLEKRDSRKKTKAEQAGHALDGILCCNGVSTGGKAFEIVSHNSYPLISIQFHIFSLPKRPWAYVAPNAVSCLETRHSYNTC